MNKKTYVVSITLDSDLGFSPEEQERLRELVCLMTDSFAARRGGRFPASKVSIREENNGE